MKIKNLTIIALSILATAITQSAISGYSCFYNESGKHMALLTEQKWIPPVAGQSNAYYACAGTQFGNSSYFPTGSSVRVPAGTPVYLCTFGDNIAVGTQSVTPLSGPAGTTYMVYTPAGSSFLTVQWKCTDSYNFGVCMKGNAPYSDFVLSGKAPNGVKTQCSKVSLP